MLDPRFIGTWKGSDHGRLVPGETNFWVMQRYSDGGLRIQFETHYENGIIETYEEQGKWYIEDQCYCEYHAIDRHTDRYFYVFLNPHTVHFTENCADPVPYSFYDYKVLLN